MDKKMIVYFDCFSGISGDMTLGAFIDIGVPVNWLQETISAMPLTGFEITLDEVIRNGIRAKSVDIKTEGDLPTRHYDDIVSIISGSSLSDHAKNLSLSIFEKIAVAEAEIHQCEKEKVHFHEVGAIDSIVDIVGTALCVEYLGFPKIISSHVPLGSGFVHCQHGKLPVPAPATLAILKDIPVYGSDIPQELVTPTGAAILKTLAKEFGNIPDMVIDKTGYGAGKTENETIPNVLRIISGKGKNALKDQVVIVETCIDDMNPEVFGYVMERLFEDGALDVYWIPIFMKKNRPGTMIQVVSAKNKKEQIINRILSETSTLGIRFYEAQRHMLERDFTERKTTYGLVRVKRIKELNGNIRLVPEYEVCKRIALENNIPIKEVYEKILNECKTK